MHRDDIPSIYRPLFFYGGTELLALLSRILLLSLGFHTGQTPVEVSTRSYVLGRLSQN